ncbi:MAG: hypothetical protein IJ720_00925 [Clostridia bacterium]|nr:hypothetical protein [Clostridia bacterium]
MTFEEFFQEMMRDDEFQREYNALKLDHQFNCCLMEYCDRYDMEADDVMHAAGAPQEDIDYYMDTANIPNTSFISLGLQYMGMKMSINPAT